MCRTATIPDRIEAILIAEGRSLHAFEITTRLGDVGRTSVNRALTKLKKRGRVKYLGREMGWQSITTTR